MRKQCDLLFIVLLQTTSYFGKMWGNRVVCYDVSLFTNEFHFGSILYQLYYFGSIKVQFSLRAHQRRFSSFFFQSILLNLAEPVCSASHQNLTKFWLALPIDAWGLVFVKSECDHQPTADFLWFAQQHLDLLGFWGNQLFGLLVCCPSS